MEISAELIAGAGGIILSLLAFYVPYFNVWYAELEPQAQRLLMLGALVAFTGAVFGLSCAGWVEAFPCDELGLRDALFLFIQAAIANQATYQLAPRGLAVKRAKADRQQVDAYITGYEHGQEDGGETIKEQRFYGD